MERKENGAEGAVEKLTIIIEYEDCYLARLKEYPGCMSIGDTKLEALKNLGEAMHLYFETLLEESAKN